MTRLSQEKRNLDPHTLRWAATEHVEAASKWDGMATCVWGEMQPLFASDPKLQVEMLRYNMLRNQGYNERNRATRLKALATRIENERRAYDCSQDSGEGRQPPIHS